MFLKNYRAEDLKKDLPSGIIVALVSIPIAMGYAQIAGLPPVYGLYGSLLPILVFGLITSSPRFVFGVDAAPAALVGSLVVGTLGIRLQSAAAVRVVPVITLAVTLWLLLFWLLRAGRFTKFISSPVLGGFITGICTEIILMQIPKLYGGTAGMGEIAELLPHIAATAQAGFNMLSLALGVGTFVVIMLGKRVCPKVPMSVVMMGVGAVLTLIFHLDQHGVALLPAVPPGLPRPVLPQLDASLLAMLPQIFISSFSVALVITAETLLATGSVGMAHGDPIDNNRELLAYTAANLVSGLFGCPPVSGSVSRTGIAGDFGVNSQMMSVVAAATMALVLCFATGFIGFLPVPVLTGIVIAALFSILEFDLAHKLKKVDRVEFVIFYIVFAVVLIRGSVAGVVAGVGLSFLTVVLRASRPATAFLGCIPDHEGFYALSRTRDARPIENVVLYQFNAALFFANIGVFQSQLEAAVTGNTRVVVVDARGISSVDVTATEQLLILYRHLKARGVRLYLTEHPGAVNDQLRTFGGQVLFDDHALRPAMAMALADAGLTPPYPLTEGDDATYVRLPEGAAGQGGPADAAMAEYEWVYGADADHKMREMAERFAEDIAAADRFDDEQIAAKEQRQFGQYWSGLDEEKFMDLLEMRLAMMENKGDLSAAQYQKIMADLVAYHAHLDEKLIGMEREALKRIVHFRMHRERYFKTHYPETFEQFRQARNRHRQILKQENPALAARIEAWRKQLADQMDWPPHS